jgi:hypothetical protein
MNAGEDNLLITVVKESFYLFENGQQGYTTAATAGIGDYAIGAETVATVLDFKKGASSVGKG